jgi:predicted DNA-binding protein (MmcQ/YjbR family)
LWASLWADNGVDWAAVEDLVKRSYRVVALKRKVIAIERKTAYKTPKNR